MSLKTYFVYIIILIILTFSCRKEKRKKITETRINKKKIVNIDSSRISIIKSPKYLLINKYSYGEIKYIDKIDTINESEIGERYIMMYLSIDDYANTFEEIEKTKQGIFIDTIGNGTYRFKVKFNEHGNKEIKLAIEDLAFIKNYSNSNEVLILKRYSFLNIPVKVLDSSSILGVKQDTIYFIAEKEIMVKRKDSAKFIKESQRKLDSMKKVLNK